MNDQVKTANLIIACAFFCMVFAAIAVGIFFGAGWSFVVVAVFFLLVCIGLFVGNYLENKPRG